MKNHQQLSRIKPVRGYLRREFFSEDFPLEYQVFSIIYFECLLFSTVAVISNTILGTDIWAVIFQWCYVAFCLVLMFCSPKMRMKLSKIMLLITGFVYIPIQYFLNAGYDGTVLVFMLLLCSIVSIYFKGKLRIFFISATVLEFFLCIYLQYKFPGLVVAYSSVEAKIADIVFTLLLSFAGLSVMSGYVSKGYNSRLKCSYELLAKVEEAKEKLETISNFDALTGIYNRRYIDGYLKQMVERYAKSGGNLTIMMMDLDCFKEFNDAFGHSFGDEVLRRTTQVIAETLREIDVFARFGGEEFVAVLHRETLESSAFVADRLRKAVSEIKLSKDVNITISIGVAMLQQGEDVSSLICRADEKLYEAKATGRNRVCF